MFIEKFNSLTKRVGLSVRELPVAKYFWYSGLKYAFQHSTSQAALLNRPIFFEDEIPDDQVLTKYEAKFLSMIVQDTLRKVGYGKKELKEQIGNLWELCDAEDPNTYGYFHELNKTKDTLAKVKQQEATLAHIQRKLKKACK
jgi:hypothetical protein